MSIANAGLFAGGDIRPSRFVKLSTAADFTLLEADEDDVTFGICGDWSKAAPQTGSETDHAVAGDPVAVYGPGEVCLLYIGSGGVTRGASVGSDADGKGIIVTADNKWVGALALESASENELAKVMIRAHHIGSA